MPAETNAYSPQWFEFFHLSIEEARTTEETDFICQCAPLVEFRRVVDFCCGMGRHARALSSRGYSVLGVDRDASAIAIAKAHNLTGKSNYTIADIREYQLEHDAFDVAIVMGQSFGHFDAVTNRDVLARLATGVRKRGRIVLDLWNLEFFATHQGERELKALQGVVREIKRVNDGRLFVRLDYPNGAQERFEWQLFAPVEMKQLGETLGLVLLASCTKFDTTMIPSPTEPRIQFVLERRP
jgi:SAM-dependent methyltransferase